MTGELRDGTESGVTEEARDAKGCQGSSKALYPKTV